MVCTDPTQVNEGTHQPTQVAAAPVTRNYSYQNVVSKKQAPVAQPQSQPQPQTQPQLQPAQPVQPPPKETLPIQKEEETDESMGIEVDGNGMKKGKVIFKKIFAVRKKSSVRLKEKRLRQNRQLRKVILPKNALMALNEVKGISIGDFIINSNIGGGFTAVVTVNDNQYEGKGASKILAKNNACEKALRDFVIARMRQHPRRGSTSSRPVSVTGETPMETDASENGENGESQKDDTDEVPMINLASFALFKLFSEWENEGYEIPEFHLSSVAPNTAGEGGCPKEPKEPKKAPIRNELPVNWETLHPATLLCMMRPGVTYSDLGVTGEKPNTTQALGVIVDEQNFVGTGRSKKIARRNAAVNVCNTLFGTNFSIEEPATATVA